MRFCLSAVFIFFFMIGKAQNYYLFAGTYTDSGSKGIYVYRFNAATGQASLLGSTDSAQNPSYLAISPAGDKVYCVNETGGTQPGGVSAYHFDRKAGTLKFINQQKSGGDHPCYIAINKTATWLTVGNYTGGNVSALAIGKDGRVMPAAQTIDHSGKGPHKQQDKPHVHGTFFSPDEQYLLVPDLGTDKIASYRFNASRPAPMDSFAAAPSTPGSGPRHLAFHPNKKWVYAIEELTGTVAAYTYDKGRLRPLQRLSSHPASYEGVIGSADIHLSPDGRFLYASNRGHANSIAIFAVDARGKLQLKNIQSTMGRHPRNFTIDPSGKFLLVANRDTNEIVIFKRDASTGLLQFTGEKIALSKPVFLALVP